MNTLRDLMRRKVLYLFLFAAVAIILSGQFFNFLAPSASGKIIVDMGLAAILFFGALAAIFTCGELIPREVERQTISTILSKPVKRHEFILGKFTGGLAVVFINFILMSAVFLALVFLRPGIFSWSIIKALALTLCELTVLSSIAVFFSTFSTTSAFTVTVSFSIYIIGHLTDYLIHISKQADNLIVSLFFSAIYTILPNFNNFNLRDKVVEGFYIPNIEVANIIIYGFIYILVMLSLSFMVFQEKEF